MTDSSHNNADVIVIGGGVAGLSTALQLAARKQKVILLEKDDLARGSTNQASGLLGQLRSNPEAVCMLMDSMTTLRQLEDLDGTRVFTESGSVRIAQNEARAAEIAQGLQIGQAAGLEVTPIGAQELQRRLPYMNIEDVIAACFCPTDGYLHPPDLAQLYIRVARRYGADLRPHTPVDRIVIEGGKVAGCHAGGQRFDAPCVVNAGGPWSYLVADLAAQRLPTAGIGHCYLTFGPDPAHPIAPHSPTVRDRENLIYSRPTREGALHVGIYETQPVSYAMESLPADFQMAAMRVDRQHPTIRALLAAAQRRFPFIHEQTPLRFTTGIMSWTPDGNALCGQMPDVAGLYHCAGFCGHGVMQSAAVGVLMAELILEGKCRYDLAQLEADRFYDLPEFLSRDAVTARCAQAYADAYSTVETSATASD
ncbi:MAG TPA: FAD-dependent oxidoreductase [Chthonomonadaceae bacterium]|nr:FAD-dependent oxidoreductase [Chthonomonadaceae bacterium]